MTLIKDGDDEHDFALEEGAWAWIKVAGGLTIHIADRGDHVEVSSHNTEDVFDPIHVVCFDK